MLNNINKRKHDGLRYGPEELAHKDIKITYNGTWPRHQIDPIRDGPIRVTKLILRKCGAKRR